MPSVSGNVGAVFNGGTITQPLVLSPATPGTTALLINLPTGSDNAGGFSIRVHSNDLTGTGDLLECDAFGSILGQTDNVNLFGVLRYIAKGSTPQFVTGPGNSGQETFQLAAGGEFVVSDHTGTPLERFGEAATVGFYGTAPAAKPAVTGSKAANAALASLLAQLVALGLVTDSTT